MVKTDTPEQKKEVMHSFVSGGIAGVIAKTSIAPLERIKFIYMTSSDRFSYRSAVKKAVEIVNTEGLWSLWRGNILNCTRIFFYSSIVVEVDKAIRNVRLAEAKAV